MNRNDAMPQKQVSMASAEQIDIRESVESCITTADETILLLLQKQYQELTNQHLSDLQQTLFAELTGLHFHITWTLPQPLSDSTPLPTACSVCCQLANRSQLSHCGVCGRHHLKMTRSARQRGHRFICGLGVNNYWFSITVRGTAFVQALDKANHILQQHLQKKSRRKKYPVLGRVEFNHAAHLLRFIVRSAETAALAELNQLDVKRVRHALSSMQQEQDRLNEYIQRLLPEEHRLSASHQDQPAPLVQIMLEYIHRHHTKPITLDDCARAHGHNAAYLSNLFSKAVGLSFKVYLTELRLEKSKRLLADPDRNIEEIAEAVGYASANRFRLIFKKNTGLSPSHWRETMRPLP
jgi:AraC-like DNA-binding protein